MAAKNIRRNTREGRMRNQILRSPPYTDPSVSFCPCQDTDPIDLHARINSRLLFIITAYNLPVKKKKKNIQVFCLSSFERWLWWWWWFGISHRNNVYIYINKSWRAVGLPIEITGVQRGATTLRNLPSPQPHSVILEFFCFGKTADLYIYILLVAHNGPLLLSLYGVNYRPYICSNHYIPILPSPIYIYI